MTNIADLQKCLTLVEYIVENCQEVYTHKVVRPQRLEHSFDFFSDAFPRSRSAAPTTQKKKNKPSAAIKEAAEACTRNQRAEAKDRMRSFFSMNPKGKLSVFEAIYADFFPRLKKEDFDNIYKVVMKEMASGRKKRSAHLLYGSLCKITSKQKSKETIELAK